MKTGWLGENISAFQTLTRTLNYQFTEKKLLNPNFHHKFSIQFVTNWDKYTINGIRDWIECSWDWGYFWVCGVWLIKWADMMLPILKAPDISQGHII